jgi:amino acid adenylation domain-containing protein
VSRHLRSLGVGPDVPVAICAQRSTEMVVGLLGILKSGGACVPLDPAYPKEQLAFMIEDSGSAVLLTQESLCLKFRIPNCQVLHLDRLRHASGATADEPSPPPTISADNLAYIIYTSGSTGAPKGVELSHRGLVNLVTWHQRTYRVTPQDRAMQSAGFSFDASVWELWPYLTAGATIHMVDDQTRASAPALAQWLNAARVTLGFVTTPLAEELLTLSWPKAHAVRALLTGGDKLHRRPDPDLPFPLVNHYGPTENTVVATSGRVDPSAKWADDAPPIGRPIANVRAYVLDRLLRLVPIGVPGELYLGGDGLARGYRHDPALTAEKFIPDPFSDKPGARLYRTGDQVCWRANGNLEFLGRIDHQMKIRGYRIEPAEIESRLNRHPAVRESLVLARGEGPGQKRLVAYLVLKQGAAPANKELFDFLRTTLPDYMVPSAFVVLPSWPLAPNGKVDHHALPVPEQSGRPSRKAFAAARNPFEETVARIWSDILHRPRVGVHDNFFELGGHSLLAAQAVSRLQESFRIQLSIRSLFEKPTVAHLAREIEHSLTRGAPRREPGIARVSRDAYRVDPAASAIRAGPVKQR